MPPDGFSGGDRLRNYLDGIAARVASASQVAVGFLEGATEADGVSVAMIAAIQEFGAPKAGIPPRPFFRTMIAAKAPGWGGAMAKILKSTDYDAGKTLGQMGEGMKGQLQESIIAVDSPALSPITLMLRKMLSEDQSLVVTGKVVGEAARRVAEGESTAGAATKPLDYTGHLLNSVDYEVKA